MSIRVLPQNLVNKIAAGEVIERPANIIKELIENSIDAGATSIAINVKNAGKTYISVKDNGCGMNKNDLQTCILRHATSKLPTDDLFNINFLGFRGEALPSISSISKLTITTNNGKECWQIKVENSAVKTLTPASITNGTQIEVEDLFYNIPARLNFLKTDRAEMSKIIDIVERIALSNPDKTFMLNDILILRPTNSIDRIASIMGTDFKNNAIEIDTQSYNIKIKGYICRPTFTRATSAYQYIYVNGRSLDDKSLQGVIKAAYMDTMEKGKFPSVCLWLTLPNEDIDVNVHPQKAEIRFKQQAFVRGSLISVIRKYLADAPVDPNVISPNYFKQHENPTLANIYNMPFNDTSYTNPYLAVSDITADSYTPYNTNYINYLKEMNFYNHVNETQTTFDGKAIPPSINPASITSDNPNWQDFIHYPLGTARGQLHKTYIISQTTDGIVITDQHAVHERLVYEKLKNQILNGNIKRQILLIPETINLGVKKTAAIMDIRDELLQFGLVIEEFGADTIIVREIPALIGLSDITGVINHIAEDINDINKAKFLENKIAMFAKTYSCHTAIRAGKELTIDEMNELLRQVEQSDNAGECNHGRRAYVKLNLYDLGKLFDR